MNLFRFFILLFAISLSLVGVMPAVVINPKKNKAEISTVVEEKKKKI
jgi:hypothetical protein